MLPLYTIASVVYRAISTAKINLGRAKIVANGPDIGSPEYMELRSIDNNNYGSENPPSRGIHHGSNPSREKSYRSLVRYSSNYQSPRAQSLSSRVKTGGKKHSYRPSATRYLSFYEGGSNRPVCRKGYRFDMKSGMCVKQ
jgi:hypothetical protein